MNLYAVYPRRGDWCCYVFAETQNKARARVVGYFDSEDEYIDFGAKLVRKDVGGIAQVCDENCKRLELLGVRYRDEEDFG